MIKEQKLCRVSSRQHLSLTMCLCFVVSTNDVTKLPEPLWLMRILVRLKGETRRTRYHLVCLQWIFNTAVVMTRGCQGKLGPGKDLLLTRGCEAVPERPGQALQYQVQG